ncbi:MAG: hypothetical protein ACM3U0_00765 [archaeon]
MMRKYLAASRELEKVLQAERKNNAAMKKLIICYTQTSRPYEALNLFYELISRDIEIIINTDQIADDCPCPGLIGEIEVDKVRYEDTFIKFCMLGILWLYCDVSVSLRYFKKACEIDNGHTLLNQILSVYENYVRIKPQ